MCGLKLKKKKVHTLVVTMGLFWHEAAGTLVLPSATRRSGFRSPSLIWIISEAADSLCHWKKKCCHAVARRGFLWVRQIYWPPAVADTRTPVNLSVKSRERHRKGRQRPSSQRDVWGLQEWNLRMKHDDKPTQADARIPLELQGGCKLRKWRRGTRLQLQKRRESSADIPATESRRRSEEINKH